MGDIGSNPYDLAVSRSPQLRRGLVWCSTCGRKQAVNSATCLRSGWPKCCGRTMTIDSPEERAATAVTKENFWPERYPTVEEEW